MKHIWIKAALLLSLAACGPLASDDEAGRFFQTFGELASSLTGSEEESTQAGGSSTFDRASIEAAPTDLMRISLISFEATDILMPLGSNGSARTWVSRDGASFTFRRGVLVGTRGIGNDLMGADVTGAIASLSGGGSHQRTLDFLDGQDQIQTTTVRCQTISTGRDDITIFDRTYVTTVFEESCSGQGISFKNTYWRDASGVIWQSRQWISEDGGYLGYQRL